jgi:hypothetical protein
MKKWVFILTLLTVGFCLAQDRPSLFFREDWKETPAVSPVTQEHVSNENLVLNLYGPGKLVKKSHHDEPKDDPYYVWSGQCTGNWAVTLKHKGSYVDLTGLVKIKWRTKQAGLRRLYIILKLADGSWIISDKSAGPSKDWRIREFNMSDIKWYSLDILQIVEGKQILAPDLSKIDEIGFTDLMRGGKSTACSRLDWMEVYGKSLKR